MFKIMGTVLTTKRASEEDIEKIVNIKNSPHKIEKFK